MPRRVFIHCHKRIEYPVQGCKDFPASALRRRILGQPECSFVHGPADESGKRFNRLVPEDTRFNALLQQPVAKVLTGRAPGMLASAGKTRGGGDARASSTTSNAVRRRQTPGALRVAGGADPSALLRLLDDAWASPASPHLASGPAAPATRPIRLLPRAVRPAFREATPFLVSISRQHSIPNTDIASPP